jgi:hypothetical protein
MKQSQLGGKAMELTDSLKSLFKETAQALKGSTRRLFMARTDKELGPGGQRTADGNWAGTALLSVKAAVNSKAVSPLRMLLVNAVVRKPKYICLICLLTSKLS